MGGDVEMGSVHNELGSPSSAASGARLQPSTGDSTAPVAATAPAAHPPEKEKTVKNYEAQLGNVRYVALISTGLYSLNSFLGVCALTWASTVILGGLLPELSESDFYSVTSLILLEAIRLAVATFFGNLVTRKLVYRSTHPAQIKYDVKDRHVILALARIADQVVQLVALAVSICLPWKRLPDVSQQSKRQAAQQQQKFDGLGHALRIFYILVLLNAAVAMVRVILSKYVVPFFATTFSLRRYYDNVVWRGMEKGFLHATDFDFLAFAFKTQAEEYRSNLRASAVYGLYQDLICYVYAHRRGFDAARVAMDSSDHCEQEAAANIVGLWAEKDKARADMDGVKPSLRLQTKLLTKLADALDHQETGRAATSSFESLAKYDPEGMMDVKNQSGEKLLHILMECIDKVVKAQKHDKALVFIKVLIQLLNTEAGRRELADEASTLIANLKEVFEGPTSKKRTQAVAGQALTLLGHKPSEDQVETFLRSRLPSDPEEHILEDEAGYLKALLGQEELPSAWGDMVKRRSATAGSTVITSSSSCIEALAALILIILAAAFLLHFL